MEKIHSEDAMLAVLDRWETWPDDEKDMDGFNQFMRTLRLQTPALLRWSDFPRSQVENEIKGRFLSSGLIHL